MRQDENIRLGARTKRDGQEVEASLNGHLEKMTREADGNTRFLLHRNHAAEAT
jgi:quinol monooxygenase YgiN